jgi:hypothetical protein
MELEPQQSKGLKRQLRDLINEKEKERKLETRAKSMKRINSIDCVGIRLQSVMTYTYLSSRT